MQENKQSFERKIIKISRREEFERRGSQDPPRRDAQFKTTSDGQHERGRELKTEVDDFKGELRV